MKSSFLLHIDSLCILDDLDDEQKGQLFFAIYKYQLGEEIELSPLIKIAFSQFKNQFIRDNEAYKKTVEARKLAGAKGGKQKVANASKSKQKVTNVAVKDKDKDKDSVKDSDSVIPKGIDMSAYPNINLSALEEWLKHKRYKSQAPITKVLNMLCGYTQGQQQDMVDTSIMNGWKGLFEPKQQQQHKQPMQSFKQQDAQKTESSIDAYFRAKEQGLDLRKPNCGLPLNDDYQDVEVIENVK